MKSPPKQPMAASTARALARLRAGFAVDETEVDRVDPRLRIFARQLRAAATPDAREGLWAETLEALPRPEADEILTAISGVDPESAAPDEPEASREIEPVLVRVSDVKRQEVEWLVRDRFALRKLSLLAGVPGLGKSYLTADLVARVTVGGESPDPTTGDRVPQGSVVMLAAEDNIADTIAPRLDLLGADTTRVHILTTLRLPSGKLEPFSLAYVDQLERAIDAIGDVRLVVIDPITSYVGSGVDDHKNAALRTLLGPLQDMAERTDAAFLLISHLNKGGGTEAINRITGSLAYVAMARTVWLVARDPNDRQRRMVLSVKNNLSENSTGLAFGIVGGRVEWEGNVLGMTADEALREAAAKAAESRPKAEGGGRFNASKLDQCEAWLLASLGARNPIPSEEIIRMAEEKGFNRDYVFEAKKRTTIKPRRSGPGGEWEWHLPDGNRRIDPGEVGSP